MKRLLFIVLAACLPVAVFAQQFTCKANIAPASHTAFYNIPINADIVAHCNNQLQDLRLLDNDGNEVPYLLNETNRGSETTQFVTYPFNIAKQGNSTVVTIENKDKRSLHQFLFQLKNADASRLLRISGSDNKTDWFVVRDSFYFESNSGNNTATIQKTIQFPETDYAFYKIEINNGKNEAPLNIVKIGDNNTSSIGASFQQVNGVTYTFQNKDKSTFIHVNIRPGNKIDRLTFEIAAPEMYKREVLISKSTNKETVVNSYSNERLKRETRHPTEDEMSTTLSSNSDNTIDCSHFLGDDKYDAFTIQIMNEDNAPLDIRTINAFQLSKSITAKLESGKSYSLHFGDSLLAAPSYDLVYFRNNIPENIAGIEAQGIQEQPHHTPATHGEVNNDKWVIWVGLAAAGLIILLLTLNMMKKMKQSEG